MNLYKQEHFGWFPKWITCSKIDHELYRYKKEETFTKTLNLFECQNCNKKFILKLVGEKFVPKKKVNVWKEYIKPREVKLQQDKYGQ